MKAERNVMVRVDEGNRPVRTRSARKTAKEFLFGKPLYTSVNTQPGSSEARGK